MFKIENGTIHCSRGDKGTITLKLPVENTDEFYKFKPNDKVKLNIYSKKGYNEEPLKTIETIVEEESESIEIQLTEKDTTFGEILNKKMIFWYDITLNENQTIVCFDEDGAKEFIQYPAKGDGE